jgi:hypothetical protein
VSKRASLLLVCLPLLLLPGTGSANHRRCVSHSAAKTIIRDKFAVVIEKAQPSGERFRIHYGCLFSVGKFRQLDYQNQAPPNVGYNFQIAGRYAAFVNEQHTEGLDPNQITIRTVDLRMGSRKDLSPGDNGMEALVLKRNGSLAWAAPASSFTEVNIYRFDSTNTAGTNEGTQLEARADSGSLAMSSDRRTIYWTKNGVPRSASID